MPDLIKLSSSRSEIERRLLPLLGHTTDTLHLIGLIAMEACNVLAVYDEERLTKLVAELVARTERAIPLASIRQFRNYVPQIVAALMEPEAPEEAPKATEVSPAVAPQQVESALRASGTRITLPPAHEIPHRLNGLGLSGGDILYRHLWPLIAAEGGKEFLSEELLLMLLNRLEMFGSSTGSEGIAQMLRMFIPQIVGALVDDKVFVEETKLVWSMATAAAMTGLA